MALSALRVASTARFTNYEDQSESLVIPEDLEPLSYDDLSTLRTQAAEAFTVIYGDGEKLSADDLTTLGALTDGLKALGEELAKRDEASAANKATAEELAAQAGVTLAAETEDEPAGESEDEEAEENAEGVEDEQVEELATRREVRVNLGNLAKRAEKFAPKAPEAPKTPSIRDYAMAAADVPGFSNGQSVDFLDMARGVAARLGTYPQAAYEAAAAQGKSMRQSFGIAAIKKPFAEGLTINSMDPEAADAVFAKAVDQSRLEGGSLLASGGWCAPSEVLYDLFELESNDGLLSVPEVHVSRGGIKFTPGPTFQTIYQSVGFSYTEAQDQAGNYNGLGGGSKPAYHVPCPAFVENRLIADGVIITAGLLEQRAYPEVIARTIRGALVAHNHQMSGRQIAAMVTGSTAVQMPANAAGTLAPLLQAIELQAIHYRYTHRMPENAVLEGVFPFWVRGAIRADLSRRLGTDLDPTNVTNQQIAAWFNSRGIVPQFVYDWQDVAPTAASGFTSWAGLGSAGVQFLMYAAGTWVRGTSDIITLDTVYDSTLLGTNDYTALFTEEGWLMAKRGHDSRLVTVPFNVTGALKAGLDILADGSSATV